MNSYADDKFVIVLRRQGENLSSKDGGDHDEERGEEMVHRLIRIYYVKERVILFGKGVSIENGERNKEQVY